MNALNRLASSIFDFILKPFELLGTELALVLASGVCGILALLIFKQISWQKGIKATKDKIKGHMIAIRIYQDDLAIVFASVFKVLLRNVQYLALNFGPILPLLIPFVFVMAQLVVRYAFAPIPVVGPTERSAMLPGDGTLIEVRMKRGREAAVAGLSLILPPNFEAVSPLVRSAVDGLAFQEVVARAPGAGEIRIEVDGQSLGTKAIVAGDEPTRQMQPERVSSFWSALLWPAEPMFAKDAAVESIRFDYPDRGLSYLPNGAFGVVLVFLFASLLFGAAILKPLNIQI
jgi:hypothetical protein